MIPVTELTPLLKLQLLHSLLLHYVFESTSLYAVKVYSIVKVVHFVVCTVNSEDR